MRGGSDPAGFLRVLFGPDWAPHKVNIWQKRRPGSGGTSAYLDRPDQADDFSGRTDVYVPAGLLPRDLGAAARGKTADVVGIPGAWLDVDVNGGPTHKRDFAPDEDAALELIRAVAPPTLIIRSGYGLQAWWLFEQPWTWEPDNAEQRSQAQQLVHALWLRASRLARDAGYKLDNTQDLARLMRLPGTINGKGGLAAPATWLDADEPGPRYPTADLAAIGDNGATPHSNVTALRITPGRYDDKQLAALLQNDEAFTAAWKREGRPPEDASPSGWCLRLANLLVRAKLDDQQIADFLDAYRRMHDDDEKPPSWYGRTIAKARTGRDREQRSKAEAEARDEALGELEDMAYEPGADPDRAMGAVNVLIPGLQAKELSQQGKDRDSARFALVLADGSEVEIGTTATLFSPDRFREAVGATTGLVMGEVKRSRWLKAVQGLLNARRLVDAESEEDVTVGWLQSYLDGRLPQGEDWNDAAYGRQPFRRDGFVHVSLGDLHLYVRRGAGEAINRSDLQRRITRVGFEKQDVSCSPPGKSGKAERTKRTFWRIAEERLA